MVKHNFYITVFWAVSWVFFGSETTAQIKHQEAMAQAVEGLSLRSIGPALMGGRIAHIAVSATDASTWYIAAGSGGYGKPLTGASPGPQFLMIRLLILSVRSLLIPTMRRSFG